MSELESGLLLPIRFYNALSEQDRYKNQSKGVSLTELNYPFVDCSKLAPFQLYTPSLDYSMSISIQFKAVCADTEQVITLPYDGTKWLEEATDNGNYWSYLGNDDFSGLLNNGLFYLTVNIVFGDGNMLKFYSDLFMIGNCAEASYDTDEFRLWGKGNDFRSIDLTDLRII